FLQQVIGKLDVGLVDLIDQQHGALAHGERLPQLALADVVADVGDARVTKLAIAQAAYRVVFVKALQRLGRRFDVPLNERGLDCLGDLDGKHRLAGAGLALDEQGSLERDGGVDCDLEIFSGDVGFGALELHWRRTAPRLAKRRASLGGEGVGSKRAHCGKGERPRGAGSRQRPPLPSTPCRSAGRALTPSAASVRARARCPHFRDGWRQNAAYAWGLAACPQRAPAAGGALPAGLPLS